MEERDKIILEQRDTIDRITKINNNLHDKVFFLEKDLENKSSVIRTQQNQIKELKEASKNDE